MAVITLIIAALVVIVDQIIKVLVNVNLKPAGSISVFGDAFKLTYVENRGVAFGMFKDMRWVFVVVTSIMLVLTIYILFVRLPKSRYNNWFVNICIALVLGGGIGNLIDRIVYGYVIDYLSLSFFSPVCNFADYCITGGVIALIIYLLFFTNLFKSNNKVKKND